MMNKDEQNVIKNSWCLIPPTIWERDDLNLTEKALLGRINALQESTGKCYASNSYLSKQLKKSSGTIANIISKLVKQGVISREISYKKGTKEIESRYLFINSWGGIHENVNRGIHENVKDRVEVLDKNIDNIQTSNKTNTSNKEIHKSLLELFNRLFDRKLFSYRGWDKNCDFWLETYTVEQIEKAIFHYRITGWWDFTDPHIKYVFYKRTNSTREDCDNIDTLLNRKVPKLNGIEGRVTPEIIDILMEYESRFILNYKE